MSDGGAEPFPDDKDLLPPGNGVSPSPPSKELIAFFETETRLKKQKQLLQAQVVRTTKKVGKIKKAINDRQVTAMRWAERYADAKDEAERQSLFKEELQSALRRKDRGVVQMLKDHARAERRRSNESRAGQPGSYEPRAPTGALPPAEGRGHSAVFPDEITVE